MSDVVESLMKVLVVDDNKDGVELLNQILEDECQIVTAFSGKECLKKAADECPDLILLDVNMSLMDGYETMQQLRLNPVSREIPVIFVSAYYTETSMVVKGLEQGAFDYLIKPVDEEILLAKISVVKRIKEAEDLVIKQKNELQAINQQLSKADNLKTIFLASMSHELRTPLNSIIGFTSLLLMEVRGKINAAQKEQLTRVKRNADHLLSLINDVLDISKVESGQCDLTISKFDLVELVRETTQNFEPEMKGRGLEFEVTLLNSVLVIESDARRVRQILINFIGNAVKFTHEGVIFVEMVADENQRVRIVVRDTGIGIKEKHLGKLFEPFQRGSMEHMQSYKGTGLGLYLSQKLSQMIEGNIQVSSEFGVGSEFSLELPLSLTK